MIDLLIYILILVLVFGFIAWLIPKIGLPEPWGTVALGLTALVCVLLLLSMLLGGFRPFVIRY